MSKKVLFIAVISLFLLLLVPYFQNVIEVKDIAFFTVKLRYSSAFRLFISMGMILGSMITLFIQEWIKDIKNKSNQNKFEM